MSIDEITLPRKLTETDLWNDYRRNYLTPNGWRHAGPDCYKHQETGILFFPYEAVTLEDGTVTARWRVLATQNQAPDPNRQYERNKL